MSDLSSFLSTQNKAWSTQLWDGLIEAIGARLAPLEENLGIQREVTDAIIARGLTVIEQELAPIVAQADEILSESTAEITAKLERFEQKVTGGTVIAMSTSSASLSNGATINLTLVVEDREFFAPTPYLALSRASTTANWALAKVNSFNRSTGALSITLEQVTGAGGPYTDWVITSLPAATLIQKAYLEQTLLAKTAAEGSAGASATSAAASQASRVKSEEARDQSVTAKAGSESALSATQGVLAEARMMIAEPLVPPTNPVEGQLWWDGSVVRVYDGVAFVPTVTASIGGLRFESGVVGDLTDATLTVGGGFSSLMLFVNGVLQVAGVDYTAISPDVVLDGDYADTDLYYVWAYQAIDSTDYDTKEQVNDKIDEALTEQAVRVDVAQAHTPAEQGQARANIGAFSSSGGTISGETTVDGSLIAGAANVGIIRIGPEDGANIVIAADASIRVNDGAPSMAWPINITGTASNADLLHGNQIRAGSAVVTTNASGDGTITYTAFPNGAICAVASHGDLSGINIEAQSTGVPNGVFNVKVTRTSDGSAVVGNVIINYMVIGY